MNHYQQVGNSGTSSAQQQQQQLCSSTNAGQQQQQQLLIGLNGGYHQTQSYDQQQQIVQLSAPSVGHQVMTDDTSGGQFSSVSNVSRTTPTYTLYQVHYTSPTDLQQQQQGVTHVQQQPQTQYVDHSGQMVMTTGTNPQHQDLQSSQVQTLQLAWDPQQVQQTQAQQIQHYQLAQAQQQQQPTVFTIQTGVNGQTQLVPTSQLNAQLIANSSAYTPQTSLGSGLNVITIKSEDLQHLVSGASVPQVQVQNIQQAQHKPQPKATTTSTSSVAKKTKKKGGGKVGESKIPKPVSAYALFFRDTQPLIKQQNPGASFGDISKIVAQKWEKLENKDTYKERADEEKKKYLQTMASNKAKEVAGQEEAATAVVASVGDVVTSAPATQMTQTQLQMQSQTQYAHGMQDTQPQYHSVQINMGTPDTQSAQHAQPYPLQQIKLESQQAHSPQQQQQQQQQQQYMHQQVSMQQQSSSMINSNSNGGFSATGNGPNYHQQMQQQQNTQSSQQMYQHQQSQPQQQQMMQGQVSGSYQQVTGTSGAVHVTQHQQQYTTSVAGHYQVASSQQNCQLVVGNDGLSHQQTGQQHPSNTTSTGGPTDASMVVDPLDATAFYDPNSITGSGASLIDLGLDFNDFDENLFANSSGMIGLSPTSSTTFQFDADYLSDLTAIDDASTSMNVGEVNVVGLATSTDAGNAVGDVSSLFAVDSSNHHQPMGHQQVDSSLVLSSLSVASGQHSQSPVSSTTSRITTSASINSQDHPQYSHLSTSTSGQLQHQSQQQQQQPALTTDLTSTARSDLSNVHPDTTSSSKQHEANSSTIQSSMSPHHSNSQMSSLGNSSVDIGGHPSVTATVDQTMHVNNHHNTGSVLQDHLQQHESLSHSLHDQNSITSSNGILVNHVNDNSQVAMVETESESSIQESGDQPAEHCNSSPSKVSQDLGKCIRTGCDRQAVQSPQWDGEFCSEECCVRYCSDVFHDWTAAKAGAGAKGSNSASDNCASGHSVASQSTSQNHLSSPGQRQSSPAQTATSSVSSNSPVVDSTTAPSGSATLIIS